MDKSFKKRLDDLEQLLKQHEPAIGLCRKMDDGTIEISMDGKKLYFDSMNDANMYMDGFSNTVFVVLCRFT